MVAQDNENRITDSPISISKGCTVSGVPDEYVHLCENKRLSIFTVTFPSISISLPCAHYHKFTTKEAVHSDTLQLSLSLQAKGTTWYFIGRPGRASISSSGDWTHFKDLLSKNLVLYSYHIGINEAAHAEERDRTQKRGKFGQNHG